MGDVVQFPGSTNNQAAGIPTPEQTKEKVVNSIEYVMKLIETNRVKGIQDLKKKIEDLENRVLHPDPATESALRDAKAALSGVLSFIEAEKALVDSLRRDMMSLVMNSEGYGEQSLMAAAHIQALLHLLIQKNVITHEEMQETWSTVVAPQLQKIQEAQKVGAGMAVQMPSGDKPES